MLCDLHCELLAALGVASAAGWDEVVGGVGAAECAGDEVVEFGGGGSAPVAWCG